MGQDSNTVKQKADLLKGDMAIPLQVLTDQQIKVLKISKEYLWYISIKGNAVGPFHRDDLKKFLDENPTFPREVKIANASEKVWLPIFKIPEFQRRKPHIVNNPDESQEISEYFLLKNGQKKGPFTLDYITQQIDEKDLLFNDLISIDNGESWLKIFEFPHFNRRQRTLRHENQGTLPHLPDEEIFLRTPTSGPQVLFGDKNLTQEEDEKEGLIGLAYIGKLRSKSLQNEQYENQKLGHGTDHGHFSQRHGQQSHGEEKSEVLSMLSSAPQGKKKLFLFLALSMVLGLLTGFFFYKNKNKASSTDDTGADDGNSTEQSSPNSGPEAGAGQPPNGSEPLPPPKLNDQPPPLPLLKKSPSLVAMNNWRKQSLSESRGNYPEPRDLEDLRDLNKEENEKAVEAKEIFEDFQLDEELHSKQSIDTFNDTEDRPTKSLLPPGELDTQVRTSDIIPPEPS